jgi:hypothetical protein
MKEGTMKHGLMLKAAALMMCGAIGAMLAPACDGIGLGGGGGYGGGGYGGGGYGGGGYGGGGYGGGGYSGGGGAGGAEDAQALMQNDLDDPDPAGGVTCNGPVDCLNKCNAEAKYCVAGKAVHPYKGGSLIGDLYQCIDSWPKAKYGGSYTCLYRYPNGDACIFAYPMKLGPIHPPAPPPLCSYKSP